MRLGALEAQRRQGIDLAIDFGDAFFQNVEQIERGDLACVQFANDGAGRFFHQFLISHSRFSYASRLEVTDGVVL